MSRHTVRYQGRDAWTNPDAYTTQRVSDRQARFVHKMSRGACAWVWLGGAFAGLTLMSMLIRLLWSFL